MAPRMGTLEIQISWHDFFLDLLKTNLVWMYRKVSVVITHFGCCNSNT